jgi:hypothetical protein
MKTHKLKVTLNEIKRMQQLAGILNEEENPYDSFFDDDTDYTPKSNNISSKYKNVPSLEKLEKMMKENNGSLWLSRSDIEALPQGLKVKGHLDLRDCTSLKELPKGLKVGTSLNLEGCTSLKELPENLEISEGGLSVKGCTSLKELPKGLKIADGGIDFRNTPIAKKYSEEEIEKMIEDGGGFVKQKGVAHYNKIMI